MPSCSPYSVGVELSHNSRRGSLEGVGQSSLLSMAAVCQGCLGNLQLSSMLRVSLGHFVGEAVLVAYVVTIKGTGPRSFPYSFVLLYFGCL